MRNVTPTSSEVVDGNGGLPSSATLEDVELIWALKLRVWHVSHEKSDTKFGAFMYSHIQLTKIFTAP